VPLSDPARTLSISRSWSLVAQLSPEELFDSQGRLKPELAALAPRGDRRMGANPNANGGNCCGTRMPDFTEYAVDVSVPGTRGGGDTRALGPFLRDVAS